jgi:hypothetical protein
MPELKSNSNNKLPGERGYQTELAKALGVSRQRVNEMFTGKIGIGRKMSVRLERLTGIPRMSWMFPDEYANPMIKKNGDANSDNQ